MNPHKVVGRILGHTVIQSGTARKLGSLMIKSRRTSVPIPLALTAALLISACEGPVFSAADLNVAYEEAMVDTRNAAVLGSEREAAVLERLEAYFTDMTPESVREDTASVYAEDGILYDNLAVIYGVHDIEEYFVKASGEADSLTVRFLQVTNDGIDYYVRWVMLIGSEALSPDEPLKSYGVTHFRFDEDGRVLLHRDFWDAASGLYEYLPVVGGIVRQLRAVLGAEPSHDGHKH